MKSHLDIIESAGGHRAFAERLSAAGHQIDSDRTRFWVRRKAIPSDWWLAVSQAGLASLTDLAAAADRRRSAPQDAAA